jgi:hypothetical protein
MSSASDWLAYKKNSQLLSLQGQLPPVLGSRGYTGFVEYQVEKSVQNTKQINSQLQFPQRQIIYGMELDVSNCPTFAVCTETNARVNRQPLLQQQFAPRPQRPVYRHKNCRLDG